VIQRIFFLRFELGGKAHRMRAGNRRRFTISTFSWPIKRSTSFDRDVRLALRIGIDRDHLVFAGDTAALVDEIDRDLGAHRAGHRAAGGKMGRTGRR